MFVNLFSNLFVACMDFVGKGWGGLGGVGGGGGRNLLFYLFVFNLILVVMFVSVFVVKRCS